MSTLVSQYNVRDAFDVPAKKIIIGHSLTSYKNSVIPEILIDNKDTDDMYVWCLRPLKQTGSFVQRQNIARDKTDPGYWVYNLNQIYDWNQFEIILAEKRIFKLRIQFPGSVVPLAMFIPSSDNWRTCPLICCLKTFKQFDKWTVDYFLNIFPLGWLFI